MDINSIETADCNIITNDVNVKDRVIEFTFEKVHYIDTQSIIPNLKVIFYDWQNFTAYKYIPKTLDYTTDLNLFDKALVTDPIEHFHMIQQKSFLNGIITLEGFSLESSQWMIYEIYLPKIDFVT